MGEVVTIDSVLQTHNDISGQFGNGKGFDELVIQLDNGFIDPLAVPFLKLDVFEWPGRGLYSINNRRLYCLKVHQDHMRPFNHTVRINVRIYPLPQGFADLMAHPAYEKFMRSY